MLKIEAYNLVKIHDESPRHRLYCDDCGMRRLCTQITLKHSEHQTIRVEWLCNECLTKTPNWQSRWC